MASFNISVEGLLETPYKAGDQRASLHNVANVLKALQAGSVNSPANGDVTVKLTNAPVYGTGTVVFAGAAAVNDTVTIAGTALTATKKNATATVQFQTAQDNDEVVIGGVTFVAKSASPSGLFQFLIGANDTASATNLTAKVNAYNALAPTVLPVTATSATDTVTLRATASGTGGNSLTLTSTDGAREVLSGANFAGGAAAANNAWDPGNTAATAAASLAAAVNASSTAAVSGNVVASVSSATVTLTARAPGQGGNVTLTKSGTNISVSGATLTGGALGATATYEF